MERPKDLALYHFSSCPFCLRVRQCAERLGLDLELRDIHQDAGRLDELLLATGRQTVPCLRIEEADGEVRWMHESDDIIAYLEKHFG